MLFNGINYNLYLHETNFCGDLKFTQLYNRSHISGGMSISKTTSIKKSLSEFSERNSFFNYKWIKELHKMKCINLKKMILQTKNVTNLYGYRNTYLWASDSQGTASSNSIECSISYALREYYERQSLIYSFLMNDGGKKINIKCIDQFISINFLREFNECYNQIFLNDISIFNGFHVIINFGIYNDQIVMGVAGSTSLYEAINKSFIETYQMISQYHKKINDNLPFRNLKKILNEYSFLKHIHGNKDIYKISNYHERVDLRKLSTMFPFEIYAFPILYNINNYVVTTFKILSFDGFPSILTDKYDANDFNLTTFKGKHFIPNNFEKFDFY